MAMVCIRMRSAVQYLTKLPFSILGSSLSLSLSDVGCFIFMGHFPAAAAALRSPLVQGHRAAVDSAPASRPLALVPPHSISAALGELGGGYSYDVR